MVRSHLHTSSALATPVLGSLEVCLALLPQVDAADLPAHRLRELGDEGDLPRVLVRRGGALDVLLELARQRLRADDAGLEDDEGLDSLTELLVGDADHRGLCDRRVLE